MALWEFPPNVRYLAVLVYKYDRFSRRCDCLLAWSIAMCRDEKGAMPKCTKMPMVAKTHCIVAIAAKGTRTAGHPPQARTCRANRAPDA
jgi:hypothetical protein